MQIAADELDVALTRSTCSMSDTWLTPDQGTTSGSQSIKTNFPARPPPACAEARQALIDLGREEARRAGEHARHARTEPSSARRTRRKRATYGELIGGQRFNLRSPAGRR